MMFCRSIVYVFIVNKIFFDIHLWKYCGNDFITVLKLPIDCYIELLIDCCIINLPFLIIVVSHHSNDDCDDKH